MSKVSDFVESLDISVGATYRGNCPKCGGHKTFTASNNDGYILFNCYKHSCRIHGVSKRNLDVAVIKDRLNSTYNIMDDYERAVNIEMPMPAFLSVMKPNTDKVRLFMTAWNINPDDVYYDVRQDRIVFPLFHNGIMVDAIGRSVFSKKQPKWLRYASSPIPYMYGEGDIMVIVEDAISAYRIGNVFPNVVGVALLGTQLTDFHKWFFKKYFRYNKIIVALDHDAFTKSLTIAKELRAELSKGVSALKLTEDLKYLHSSDVEALKEML